MTSMHRNLVGLLFGAVVVLAGVNALLYAMQAATPLIISDDWYYLDKIVRKFAEGQSVIGEMFDKRWLDHAQPLRRLILLFHYHYFDLDYAVGAIIGVLAAFLNLGLMWMIVRQDADGQPAGALRLLAFAALTGVYLSLNAPVTFNWPLLTLSYTSHSFILLFLWAAWWAFRQERASALVLLAACALLMDLVADDTAMVATLAALLAIACAASRTGYWRSAGRVSAVMVGAYALYLAFQAWITFGLPPPERQVGEDPADLAAGLIAQISSVAKFVQIPLTASVAHRAQMKAMFGPDIAWAGILTAIALLAAHVWFWWRAFRGKQNAAAFVATGLMLLFYGLVAGIVISRVSLHSAQYLWMPRYTLVYTWNLVALLLMALSQLPSAAGEPVGEQPAAQRPQSGVAGRWLLGAGAACLLLLQVPISLHAWGGLRYVRHNQQGMALHLGRIAAHPQNDPGACSPRLTLCTYDAAQRAETIAFLRKHRLNIFSPAFRARHRLYLDGEAVPR